MKQAQLKHRGARRYVTNPPYCQGRHSAGSLVHGKYHDHSGALRVIIHVPSPQLDGQSHSSLPPLVCFNGADWADGDCQTFRIFQTLWLQQQLQDAFRGLCSAVAESCLIARITNKQNSRWGKARA